MRSIYRSIKGGRLDGKLTPEMRNVFETLMRRPGEKSQSSANLTKARANLPLGSVTSVAVESGDVSANIQVLPPSTDLMSMSRETSRPPQATGTEVTTTALPASAKAMVSESGEAGFIKGKITTMEKEIKARGSSIGERRAENREQEGRSPSAKLKEVFAKLKAWLLEFYRTVKGSSLDVGLNDRTRQLFDELVSGEGQSRLRQAKNLPLDKKPEVEPGGIQPEKVLPPSTDLSQPRNAKPGRADLGTTTLGLTTTAPPATAKATAESGEAGFIKGNVATDEKEIKTRGSSKDQVASSEGMEEKALAKRRHSC